MTGLPRSEKELRKAAQRAEEEHARQGQQRASKEAQFWASAYGQAWSAKLAGDRYFQSELEVDSTQQGAWSKAVADIRGTTRRYNGQGAVLTQIEREGWELIQAGFVFKETGQVSRDKFLSSGQQVSTSGTTVGIYLFRATDAPSNTEEYWLNW